MGACVGGWIREMVVAKVCSGRWLKNVKLQKDCARECSCESGLACQCARISEYEARLVLGRQTKDNRAWAVECGLEFLENSMSCCLH